MKGAFRCVIFALLCEYGHAQCCVGSHTDLTSSNPFFPTDSVQCNNMGKNWVAACESGLSCLVLTCSGTLGTNTGMFYTKLVSSCTTAQLQTASIAAEETAMLQGGYTEVQCVAAAVTTHTCSNSSNSSTSSGGNVLTSCSCNPGYTASDGGPCSPCPYGTYKDSIGQYSIVVLCCLSLYLSNFAHCDL
jgi:hypothetical protein